MWILAPAFLAIYIAFTASPAAPAEYTRSGSVIYITGEIGRMITPITAEERAGQSQRP